jgi:ATP-binding cassette subfamily A (ABC1) protein 3
MNHKLLRYWATMERVSRMMFAFLSSLEYWYLYSHSSSLAGKTSTVSVLTGLFRPTSGDCILYGKSIVNDLMEARQSIGICPQHNILFDSLTVYEHLAFFMRMKGIRPSDAKIRSHAEEIGLSDYLRTPSAALSGGNKRKLSVAIALSGDPR